MTKVIAIEWLPNTWKSTLIERIKWKYTNTKFYNETAREVMEEFDSIQNRDMQSFQDIIYHKEAQRVFQIKEDIRKWIYDFIVIDRTSLWNWIFAMYNKELNIIDRIHDPIYDPKLYDLVLYMNEPIGKYSEKNKAFKQYETDEFIIMFDAYIWDCFPNVQTYSNYLEKEKEIDLALQAFKLWNSISNTHQTEIMQS